MVIVAASLNCAACAATLHPPPRVCTERRVYVESFVASGFVVSLASDFAAQFGVLLQGELPRQGFEVVRRPEDADVVLTGILAVSRPSASGILGRALNGRNRQELWRKVYAAEEPRELQPRAKDLAQDLLEACYNGWRKRD